MVPEIPRTDKHVPFDGAAGRIYRALGPPGTGKTSWLVRQSERAADEFGPVAVRVVSMTKAAAREFARRESPLPPENVSTLHALAYRALDRPKLIDSTDLKDWNSRERGFDLSGVPGDVINDGFAPAVTAGDVLLAAHDLARARRSDPRESGGELGEFARRFGAWKAEIGKLDFTDLLERALDEVPTAPGRPAALFVDEAQDLSTLELALVEKWGAAASVVVVVGDADQSIYSWRGADPAVLLGSEPFTVLRQSFRVPSAVHEVALSTIRQSSTWSRAEYLPSDRPGRVDRVARSVEWIADDLERSILSAPAEQFPSDTIPAMVLASCGYMVAPIVAELRRRGVPYFNPFRAEWNPLARGSRERVTATDRVLAFARLGSPIDWRRAVEPLRVTAHGGPVRNRSRVPLLAEDATPEQLVAWISDVLEPGALEHFERDGYGRVSADALDWWLGASRAAVRDTATYPVACAKRFGLGAIAEPRICVGTIHSVKGGEAHTVYLSTELSRPAARQYEFGRGWDERDAVLRQFYVGITRARERLVLCAGLPSARRSEVAL